MTRKGDTKRETQALQSSSLISIQGDRDHKKEVTRDNRLTDT